MWVAILVALGIAWPVAVPTTFRAAVSVAFPVALPAALLVAIPMALAVAVQAALKVAVPVAFLVALTVALPVAVRAASGIAMLVASPVAGSATPPTGHSNTCYARPSSPNRLDAPDPTSASRPDSLHDYRVNTTLRQLTADGSRLTARTK